MIRRRVLPLLALALLLSEPLLAQLPRPAAGYLGTAGLRTWARTAAFPRTIVVDSGGAGDYASVSAGLTAAAALSPAPAIFDRVLVLVYPGVRTTGNCPYTEASLTVPAHVSLVGLIPGSAGAGSFTGHTNICLTGTSGTLVSVGDKAQIARLDLELSAALTADTVAVGKSSGTGTATMNDVVISAGSVVGDSFNLDLINNSSGGLYLEDVGIWRVGTATKTRHIVNSSATGVSHYRGRLRVGTSQAVVVETTGSGIIKLWSTRLDANGTCDLKSAAADSIEAYSVEYRTTCGAGTVSNAITYIDALSSPSGTCPPGRMGYDASYLYLCNASGAWRRVAHETF